MGFLDKIKAMVAGDDAAPHTIAPATLGHADPEDPLDPRHVIEALRQVIDPEVGVDIVNMGLVREVTVDEDRTAHVIMTLTTEGCPVGPAIVEEVAEAVAAAGFEPDLDLVFDPPWTPDDMTPEGRARAHRY